MLIKDERINKFCFKNKNETSNIFILIGSAINSIIKLNILDSKVK